MKSRVDLKAGSSWFPQDPVQVSLSKRVPAGREGVCGGGGDSAAPSLEPSWGQHVADHLASVQVRLRTGHSWFPTPPGSVSPGP